MQTVYNSGDLGALPSAEAHRAGLTPRGEAVLTLVRLEAQIRSLDASDRAYAVDMLRDVLRAVEATV